MEEYHRAHGGISRYKKFEWFFREVVGRELSGTESEAMGCRFEKAAFDAVLNAPFIAGAREFLEDYSRELPMFVASGTPETELGTIVEQRALAKIFREVHGSPRTKPEIIHDILARYQFAPNRVLFVGDAMTDYFAAQECGLAFLGVAADRVGLFPGETKVIPDLTGLYECIYRDRIGQ